MDNRTKRVLADPQLLNSYAYSRNNPLILKDDGGEIANVIIGAGGAMAAQYLYDAYNNVHANGFSASAFYSNLSSPETYAVRAVQGAAVGLTGGLVGGLSFASQVGIMGTASGVTGVLGNAYLDQPVTAQSVIVDVTFGGATFGAMKFVPGVRGAQPKFGTQRFFAGAHTLRHSQELVIDAGSNYLSTLIGSAPLSVPSRTIYYNSPGGNSAAPASSFGLSGDTKITADNIGAFVGFISQFLK